MSDKKKTNNDKDKDKKDSKEESKSQKYWSPPTFDEIRERLGTNDGPIGNTD